MKITKSQLKQIIKEELETVLAETRPSGRRIKSLSDYKQFLEENPQGYSIGTPVQIPGKDRIGGTEFGYDFGVVMKGLTYDAGLAFADGTPRATQLVGEIVGPDGTATYGQNPRDVQIDKIIPIAFLKGAELDGIPADLINGVV